MNGQPFPSAQWVVVKVNDLCPNKLNEQFCEPVGSQALNGMGRCTLVPVCGRMEFSNGSQGWKLISICAVTVVQQERCSGPWAPSWRQAPLPESIVLYGRVGFSCLCRDLVHMSCMIHNTYLCPPCPMISCA